MSGTLQDQLKALGLAKEKKPVVKKARKPYPAKKRPPNKPSVKSDAEMSLDQAYRLRLKEEKKTAHDKKENKRLLDLQRRQINIQLQDLVATHALNDKKAEVKRNFLYKGRIRSVLVTPEQLKALNAGELGLAFLRGNYIVMLPEHVELVRAISEDHVPDLGGSEPDVDEGEEHKVPDDLVW
jgi:uncharacterized protein YaiL (DUF2058 family)